MSSWKQLLGRWGSGAAEVDDVAIDASTNSLQTVGYSHHEAHAGNAFAVHLVELDFDKASEIGVLFTTPDTTKWGHCLVMVSCSTKAIFEVLEAPTVDTGNYPTTFAAPINRNRNSGTASTVSSVKGTPAANEVSLKLKGDTTPITADGLQIHAEGFGAKKGRSGGNGVRDDEEYVLKQNTTYYFRMLGAGTGDDDAMASMEITWYEHTDKH